MKQGNVFINNRSTLGENRKFINFCPVVDNLGSTFSIIFITEMCGLTGVVFDHHGMAVTYENTHCIRRQSDAVFLEGSFPGNTNVHLRSLGLYVQGFL